MARIGAKGAVLVSRPVERTLELLSKATLIDLVADLVRRMEGADIRDPELVARLEEDYLPPVCREREQKVPGLTAAYWKFERVAEEARIRE